MSTGVSTWYFAYDANGMRTKRSNGTTTYTYVYNGSRLSQMTVGSTTYYFIYDVSGTASMLQHGQDIYHYVTNIQGDVIAILDAYGNMVVEYQYDAWGNILSTSGSMASTLGVLNPLRYRGYVYDTETQLYYLESRYYNPAWGRFINADTFVSTGQGLLGNNMFAYCRNNPVNRIDISGTMDLDATDGDDDGDLNEDIGFLPGGNSNSTLSNAAPHKIGSYNYQGNSGRTEVHHIVEQCQTSKSGFDSSQIQSGSNKIALDYSLHRAISGYYSSKQDFTGGLKVRDWLAGQSFADQTAFGWKVINFHYSLQRK